MMLVNWDDNEIYRRAYQLRGEPHTYVAYVRGQRCITYTQLHAELSAALQFPRYYGENINSLSECIEDLEWLNAKKIYVYIDQAEDFLRFDKEENNAYSRALVRAEEYWEKELVEFHVFLNIGKQ